MNFTHEFHPWISPMNSTHGIFFLPSCFQLIFSFVCSQSQQRGSSQTDSRNPSNQGPSSSPPGSGRIPAQHKTGWTLEFDSGVPVVVHVARPGSRRTVEFIFAERATGLPLWRDRNLTPASGYSCIDSDYHEFVQQPTPPTASRLRVGLRFGAASAASKFLQQTVALLSNPATFGDLKGSKPPQTPKKSKQSQPKKSSISPPCCFVHRAHVEKDDDLRSLADFVGPIKGANVLGYDSRASGIYGTCRSWIFVLFFSLEKSSSCRIAVFLLFFFLVRIWNCIEVCCVDFGEKFFSHSVDHENGKNFICWCEFANNHQPVPGNERTSTVKTASPCSATCRINKLCISMR